MSNEELVKRIISTHTLRGERDSIPLWITWALDISTHTLRGERESPTVSVSYSYSNFNSHAPWGA